jgi:YVTN family beta-propeller protein
MASTPRCRWRCGAVIAVTIVAAGACTSHDSDGHGKADPMVHMSNMAMPSMSGGPATTGGHTSPGSPLPGMPPPLAADDIYAADRPNALSNVVRNDLYRVYVPNNGGDSLSVIDPTTYKVIQNTRVPHSPEHVVPSWDLRTLWINSDTGGDAVTPIDPVTGKIGTPVPVEDPYNLYFTPDGRYAMVMAELLRQVVFRDPHTMQIRHLMPVDCEGLNHADFSADGRYFIASCEFSGHLVKVDTEKQAVIGQMRLPGAHPMPQDVKISPDGRTWYIADMQSGGVWVLNGDAFTTPTFLPTGSGAHGLYVSRDSRYLYISNRGEGSISVLEFATGTLIAKWRIPGGGSPDMGGLSPDGKVLWLSGRYNGEVYAIDTGDGHLIARIKTGANPHGLCVWPQPGRYSLGHTGILR